MRALFALAAALLAGPLHLGPRASAAPPAGPLGGGDEQRMLDEYVRDVQRFTQAVKEFRGTARNVVRRELAEKQKQVKAKYEPAIQANEREEAARRKDAIAVFEAFLKKYPDDRRFTPDAMFRLGELYYEKASEENIEAAEAYQNALQSANPPSTPPPVVDFTKTIDLFKRLLTDFPSYRMLDRTLYVLGYCLSEMQRQADAKQAFLALVCSNRFKALDPPAPPPPAPSSSRAPIEDIYKDCAPIDKGSKFLAEAWMRIGDVHFDAIPSELPAAVSAYDRVLEFKDSGFYDRGLYKLAWSYYRDNRYREAVEYFDRLVKWSDERKASGEKPESDLRPESITYLGISFAEEDWDGDQLPDVETGLERAQSFYRGREQEPHVQEVFKILGDIYFDRTKFNEGIAVYKALLAKWPFSPEAPRVQQQIVRAYERDRNLAQATVERAALGNYAKGSPWYLKNRDNPEALEVAQELAENALVSSATTVHAQAIACRKQWLENRSDARKLAECRGLYRNAASLYEKYLTAYPRSKNAYEYGWHYAEALNYSDQLPEAISAYTRVRDSELDNRYAGDAALQIVKVYEGLMDRMKTDRRIPDPPIPNEKNTRPPVSPIPMPEVVQRYREALDWYAEHIQGERAPDFKYETALLSLRYRDWPEARKRLGEVSTLYCASKPDVGFKAYDALLDTYFIDYNNPDEEQKDCALGRLLSAADEFSESPCGKSPQAGPFLARIKDIKSSVKTDVQARRLKIILENEEKGTNKVIPQCREATGGIAMVTGQGPTPTGAPASKEGSKPPPREIKYEFDESTALDLMDMVNQNPKGPDAPTNLNNACVVYEKLFKFGEATRCYERLFHDYPDSPLALEAEWNAAHNHFRFFEFDQAAKAYLVIAEDPKFGKSEHRREALGQAATLMDNDQQYEKAADLYKRYADAIGDKPSDSAQAYFFSCGAYEKAKDTIRQANCLRDFVRRYDRQSAAGEFVVQVLMKQAALADSRGVLAAYKRTRDEFASRRLPAATPTAGLAAKADFLLMEEKFKAFQAKRLSLTNPKKMQPIFDAFLAEARTLGDEYKQIWDYKDATWTLASMLRMGDLYYEFAQKLIKAADDPPEDIKKLERQNCKVAPDECGNVLQTYKDAVYQMVTPMEDKAKEQWKATLSRAAQLGVTNDYVKKARENLSRYLPDEFPFIKDERIQLEQPQ